jgi:predicted LPLAT superfamily acyltransferase
MEIYNMKGMFYGSIILMSKILGPWIFVLISRVVAAGYFLFFPRRVAVSCQFYRALFPDRSRFYYLWCTWKQYQNFTSVFLDRFLARDFDDISYTSEGWKHVEAAMGTTGGVILMSHVGNWEVAAHLMRQQHSQIELLLYMGIREKEDIERIQKKDLLDSGIRIIAVDQDGGTSFDIVNGIQFLKSGGFVSMTGDKVWKRDQRTVPVEFLGHEVCLPEFPYVFALLSGAPLFIFFTFRTGRRQYHFALSEPIYIESASRGHRKEAIRHSAQKYADLLQQTVCRYPFEWYHFEPFLGQRLGEALDSDRPDGRNVSRSD